MKRALVGQLLGLSLLVSMPVFGKPLLLTGSVARNNVIKLTSEVPWYTSLSDAETQARREGKMVFWIHMLGDIKGAT
jgi:hypothetical protein